MTAEERLELAIQTMTELRDMHTRLHKQYREQGQTKEADFYMHESLTWDEALMMITKDNVLKDVARICGLEVSE